MDINVGERIRIHRLVNKLTRGNLAKLCNVSESSIAMYERAEREPGIDVLKILALRFNVTLDYLCGASNFEGDSVVFSSLDLTDDEFVVKFRLLLDGSRISKEELSWMVALVRSHRTDAKTVSKSESKGMDV